MKKIKVFFLIIIVICLFILFYFWTPNDEDIQIDSNIKLELYNNGLTDDMIQDLPYSFLYEITDNDYIGQLVAYEKQVKSNITINTLIFERKPQDNSDYNDFYLFIAYKGENLLPFYKHNFTIDWNRESYIKYTANSYFEGYDFLNRKTYYSEIPRGYGYDIIIPSIFKNAEGYIWFRIRQREEGEINFKGTYKSGKYNIQSTPTYEY